MIELTAYIDDSILLITTGAGQVMDIELI